MATIIGAALVAVALIILYVALEGLRRKEEELDKEIKEVEMRLRDCERAVDWTHRNSGGRQ